ncbi:MAG: pyruvate kinase [Agathobacter sp.]|nr:pyruvate kinase [Agathobacter sp.]
MKTEIFGTFGPACNSEEILKNMIEAGMTGMRLNLSHTTLSESAKYIDAYTSAAKVYGTKLQILIDMKGPELRVGHLKELMWLEDADEFTLCGQKTYDAQDDVSAQLPIPEEVLEVLEEADQILLDDGKILLQVISKSDIKNVKTCVLRGGSLSAGKSIKVMDKYVAMPPLTEHDIANIKVAKQYGVTALMQPFVLNGEDLRYVRSVLKEYDAEDIQIFAKIENRMGVENLEDILPEADVIVIARGDLGNDMPLWELPRIQKQIEATCKKHKKPYIVVTQMLASMEAHPVPTRAEVSDIYHAVYHGAWGVMVTGETAVGKYPVEAIRYLANTAKEARR